MFRPFLVAGAMALAAAVLGSSAPAFSADIAVEPEPMVVENNWYVSLSGGWKFGEDWDDNVDLDLCFIFCLISIDEIDATLETDDGWRVGGSVGYSFNNWFALEGEVAFMKQDFDSLDINTIKGSFFGFPFEEDCDDPDCSGIGLDGDVSTITGMINAIVGIPFTDWFRPYVGVGAGAAHVSFNDVGISDSSICCLDDSDTTFAWQLMAGADFRITDHIALGGRFRALNIGDIDLKDDGDFEHSLNPDWIKSVEAVLTFGF
jgi:OOP family OmpA-OmpF porin